VTRPSGALGARKQLPVLLADELKGRIRAGEWSEGDRLPSEAELGLQYGVSRSTVRQALKALGAQGLVASRHGKGTYLSPRPLIHAGMQELRSITSTIAERGLEPGMRYRRRRLRSATSEEQQRFALDGPEQVLDIQRRILGDGRTVAYSYDVLPRWVLPPSFRPSDLTGSVFALLAATGGPVPVRAVSEVHAVHAQDVAWGPGAEEQQLFVLLDQLHYDERERPCMHSRSYFIEGRFTFTVLRTT
jgi:GntR family transcriptional regulator